MLVFAYVLKEKKVWKMLDFQKNTKKQKNKIRQSSVLPGGVSLGCLVSIFGRPTDVLSIYIYIYTMEARKAELL